VASLALLAWNRASSVEADNASGQVHEMFVCLTWSAPLDTDCPTETKIEVAVEKMLDHRVFSKKSCDIQVSASMRQPSGGGWEADLSFTKNNGDALGYRSLQGKDASCTALMDPLSLVIALMVEATEAHATLHVPMVAPARDTVANANRVSANLSVSSGLLPTLGFGATVGFEASLADGWLPLRVDSTFWFPSSSERAAPSGSFWAWQAGLGLCPTVLSTATVEGKLCARVEGGAMRGEGSSLPRIETATKPYAELDAYAALSFPLFASLAGFIQAGVMVPWIRPSFVYVYYDGSGPPVEVHRPHAMIPFAGLGIELGAGRKLSDSTAQ
jgi:hypothetical protein